ncbi:hypothetical protein IEN85_02945 [Pelagicoccus sp. NFK12]|uniref:Uncharacterized protein n=1 Tax=Pelagicoccus enzymogenes TaxID=2773457 RepID=A0A927F5J9_9BACT|nr:hypothetical protein [Pelagicoccus enzymogenes]MBD5778435.1 hypothetical protein [Pelagicoccus enzymogenes]
MVAKEASISVRVSAFLIKTRRAFFRMTMREKVLALLFAFALVLVWGSWQLDRQSLLKERHWDAGVVESGQQNWLTEEARHREFYETQKAAIDLEALPNREEVSGQIDALVRRAGFSSFDFPPPRTEIGAEMNFHTFQLVVQKASYAKIKNFTKAIKAEMPYLSLEKVIIQAPDQDVESPPVNVRYVFKSIEYTK